jgi:DNA-binding winged helix-turn-helix (wHTH) protein
MRFGEFLFDSQRNVIRRGDVEVPLAGTASDVLRILIEHQGTTVDKEILVQRVWKEAVSDASLAGAISQLRRALGDSRTEPMFIQTRHGKGYAFIADATTLDADLPTKHLASPFVLDKDDGPVILMQGDNIVGRDARVCSICFTEPVVSRSHARIVIVDGLATIRDLGSTHGTLVRGRSVTDWVPLAHGDEIQFGRMGPKAILRKTDIATVRADPKSGR